MHDSSFAIEKTIAVCNDVLLTIQSMSKGKLGTKKKFHYSGVLPLIAALTSNVVEVSI